MRLTRQTNYSLRIMWYCDANAGRLSQVAEIAKSTATTRAHVHKMLHPLVEAQLLTTVRGRNGGLNPCERQIEWIGVIRWQCDVLYGQAGQPGLGRQANGFGYHVRIVAKAILEIAVDRYIDSSSQSCGMVDGGCPVHRSTIGYA